MPSKYNAGSSISVYDHCATVANPGLVAPATANSNSTTFDSNKTPEPINTTTLKNVEEKIGYGVMSTVWETFKSRNSRGVFQTHYMFFQVTFNQVF